MTNTTATLPLVSVIIPAYNVEPFLDRCLVSVTKQDYPNIEILLIDDASPDNSGKICDRWAEKDSRIRVFHKEYGGVSTSRNFGLAHSTGEYISFVDADDYVEPTYLSYLFNLLNRSPGCKVSQANHNILWENRTEQYYTGNKDFILSAHDTAEAVLFHDRVNVSPWGKLYHRSVFDNIRYPEGKIFEDTYVFGDILQKTETYVYGHIPQYNYVKSNPNSIVTRTFSEKNPELIEAAERLAQTVQSQYPDLEAGCIRVVNHARLSVLRYMEHCDDQYKRKRKELRKEVLKDAPKYIHHPQTPKRDKMAVLLLRLGFAPFYKGWGFYTKHRNG